MHNISTLCCPILRSFIPSDSRVLPARLSFDVKITDVDHFYELKCRLCADGSRMTEEIDFENSYAPTTDDNALRIIILQAAQYNIWLYVYDVFNVFQKNVIKYPSKRHY